MFDLCPSLSIISCSRSYLLWIAIGGRYGAIANAEICPGPGAKLWNPPAPLAQDASAVGQADHGSGVGCIVAAAIQGGWIGGNVAEALNVDVDGHCGEHWGCQSEPGQK